MGDDLNAATAANKRLVDRAQELNVANRNLEGEITRLRASIRTLEFLLGVCVLAIPVLIFALTLLTARRP